MGIGIGGGGVASGAIRAGLAVVELGVNNAPLVAGLEDARQRLGGWAAKIATVGAVVSAAGASILAPLTALMSGAIDRDKGAGGLAKMLSVSVEKASRLAYAFSAVGIEQEEVAHFTRHLSRSITEAAESGGEAAARFAQLGLAVKDLAALDNKADQFIAVGDAVGRIADPARRSTEAMHYFGRSGEGALKLVGGGAAKLKELMEEAGLVGAVVTAEQAKQAKEVTVAWKRMGVAITNAWLEVGQALIPSAELVREWTGYVVMAARRVREWVAANQPLVRGLAGIGAALAATGAALLAVAGGIKLFGLGMRLAGAVIATQVRTLALLSGALLVLNNPIALAVGGFVGLFSLLRSLLTPAVMILVRTFQILLAALTLLNSPVGLIVAAVVGLAAVWLIATDSGKEAAKALGEAFQGISDTFIKAWDGIASALKRGDLAAAGDLAFAGLEVSFLKGTKAVKQIWYDMTKAMGVDWDFFATNSRVAFNRFTTDLFTTIAWLTHPHRPELRDAIVKEMEKEHEKFAAEMNARMLKDLRTGPSGVAATEEALKAAEARLEELLKKERKATTDAASAATSPGEAGLPRKLGVDFVSSVKGLFSAPNYAGALGLGDKAGKAQFEMMRDVRDEVKKVVAKLDDLKVVFG